MTHSRERGALAIVSPPTDSLLVAAALGYAHRGWATFPLHSIQEGRCSCSKGESCGKNSGKHPRTEHGLLEASTEEAMIREWWKRWPEANVGIRTGREAGFFVLDVDPRHGGQESLAELQLEHGPLPQTMTTRTGSGGQHLIFRWPDVEVRNAEGIRPGLDIRGDGGYVLAWPSNHLSGSIYEWSDESEIAEAPAWLLDLLRSKTVAPAPRVAEVIPEGQRNSMLASLAGSMRRRGMSETAILAALKEENALRCSPPLEESELSDIAHSIGRYSPSAPISMRPHTTEPTDDTRPVRRLPTDWLEELARQATEPVPTHVPPLDLRLRGGTRAGKVVVLGGLTGTWKTALSAQIAARMAASGVAVLYWAGDEGPEALSIRLAQHVGVRREDAEDGTEEAIKALRRATSHGKLINPDPDDYPDLESVLEEVTKLPEPRAVVIDSIQCLPLRAESEKRHEAIEARMIKLRQESRKHRLAVFAISEISRASYGNRGADPAADLASFKGSGSIEYKGDTLLLLKPSPGVEGEVRVTIPKNRQGSKSPFVLRFNPETCLASEFTKPEQEREEEGRKVEEFEGMVSKVLAALPGPGKGISQNKVCDRVALRREKVKEVLLALERTGRAKREDGPRDADLWSLP
jgi:KaiC/GvpD/RAD55 family RecA-like ATPase